MKLLALCKLSKTIILNRIQRQDLITCNTYLSNDLKLSLSSTAIRRDAHVKEEFIHQQRSKVLILIITMESPFI